MKTQIGPQYPKDYPFKAKARLHQSRFLSEVLQADYQDYGNRLSEEDARAGKNFYPDLGVFDAVKKRYRKYSRGVYADMLRSEHIPFNIFVPLSKNQSITINALNSLLGLSIATIDAIHIEHAPEVAKNILKDHTSFDTYIEYTTANDEKGFLGIEVKYTELEYKLNPKSTEAKSLANQTAPYYLITQRSGVFTSGAGDVLKQDNFRQIWRNQLLGEALLLAPGNKFKEFKSITLYPEGNKHFTDAIQAYGHYLSPAHKKRVAGLTFEALFDTLSELASSYEYAEWVSWLKRRYIVSN